MTRPPGGLAVAGPVGPATSFERWDRRLSAPVDIASVAVFRMIFGAIMVWEVYRYFSKGWIEAYWISPAMNFSYPGFGWVQPLPGPGMYLLFAVLGLCGLGIALGSCYRLSAVLFCLGFTYAFLLEAARYLNHFYLICLLGLLLAVLPVHRGWSVYAARRPERASHTIPAWALWLLRFQIGIVYVYGGVAKLNGDWLRGEPMRAWLARGTDFPLLGPFFGQEWMVAAMSYGGLAFDLLVIPLLLWRRTRELALIAALLFNVLNENLFSIGIFPHLAFAGLLLFCEPDWPRSVLRRGRALLGLDISANTRPSVATAPSRSRLTGVLIGVYVAVQVVVPLRHYAYPGPSNWTEEGHQFAWHMKLRSKTGDVTFLAYDPVSRASWQIEAREVLTSWQYDKMAVRPELIRQFSWYIADAYRAEGYVDIQVRANAHVSLNGRDRQMLIDPTVDLAAEPSRLGGQPWIVPLTTPLDFSGEPFDGEDD